jgi:hypothetical protein
MAKNDEEKELTAVEGKEQAEPQGQDTLTLEQIKQHVSEDDDAPIGSLNLRTILGGDILSAQQVRRQVRLLILIVLFVTVYVAFRYQCQQDVLDIAQLENELTDAKYKALSSSSNLTERCRESHVLEALRNNEDSVLQTSNQPPYKIEIPEE